MRKHVYGLAIFLSIVTTTAVLFGIFSLPELPSISAVESSIVDASNLNAEGLDGLGSRVLTAEYDVRTDTLAAAIELTWNGAGMPPARLDYRVLISERSPKSEDWTVRSDIALHPFAGSRRAVRRVTFASDGGHKLRDLDNIYVYVDTGSISRMAKVHELHLPKAEYVPVLKVHQ